MVIAVRMAATKAKLSRDVDMLREKLEEDGYRNINGHYGSEEE